MARKISSGIFIFNHKNELLICHPTGNSIWNNWSIPKGNIDENETDLETALREVLEESNVNLYDDVKNIKKIGVQPYMSKNSNKSIVGFTYKFNKDVNFDLKCNSIITEGNRNSGKPENDIVKFVNIDEALKLLHEAQQKLLLKII